MEQSYSERLKEFNPMDHFENYINDFVPSPENADVLIHNKPMTLKKGQLEMLRLFLMDIETVVNSPEYTDMMLKILFKELKGSQKEGGAVDKLLAQVPCICGMCTESAPVASK